ncbi:MAG: 50S ribosomal protein L13 [Anaerolineae bacterium]|nr:50S ribosomal protein L13 [Anaerolineae bacterium]
MYKTYSAKPQEIQAERKWYVVDAEDQVLGRLASKIAYILRGKHKPMYTPHMDTGDYVVVINADKIRVTGNRMEDKMYHHASGYPGGLSSVRLKDRIEQFPNRPLEDAIRGMLPKNVLGREMFKKLKVYAGPNHPHEAQKPEKLEL